MASGLINRSGVSGAAWHGYKSVGHGHWYVWSLLIALALLSGCSALLDLQGGQTCETHSQCDASRYCFSQNENEPTRCQPRDNCTTNLDCEAGTACLSLGDGGGSVCTSSACGDGSVDSPETCDGDCPTTCDDSNACTVDAMEGSAELCSATCVFVPVTGCSLESDGCCPASCSASNDADCDSVCGNGLVEPGEICDGDCPNACSDADACTVDMLSGHVATCNAVCSFEEILECAHGDGCCPTGCTQLNDADCEPACGNGVIEDGETCDGDCPELCEAADSCSVSSLSGSAGDCNVVCHEASITQCGGLDGCCPAGCDQTSDADCDGSCGDEVLDPGETCDGDCPTNCEDGIACTEHLLTGTPGSCDVLCHTNIVSACVHGDGCCPAGCSFGVDDDCEMVCGNAVVEGNELCDGNCPSDCDDGNDCTNDFLQGDASLCSATCVHEEITSCVDSDGCCAAGCEHPEDNDCSPLCGNGVVDAGETCDGDCPTTCSDGDLCTHDSLIGTSATCNAACAFVPVLNCESGDGCCASGCNQVVDSDCSSICGNGILELGESCDDGNELDDGNGCTHDCQNNALCGDGTIQSLFELCDDGFQDACGTCNSQCTGSGLGSSCGDGTVCSEFETCDDGFTDTCGSCNADCTGPGTGSQCGDGTVCSEFETCDDGFTDACGDCNATCTGPGAASECGDGQLCAAFEVCDDGYTDACGTCNADCSGEGAGFECGNAEVCPEFESCDDGFVDSCGSCNMTCSGPGTGSVCGDGEYCPESESCDDGFTGPCGTCNATCNGPGIDPVCGDDIFCPQFEICDDGFTDMCGSCNYNCTALGTGAICGDGAMCPELEACDDGFTDACGSCNASCTAPGLGNVCGDGVVCPELEICDDGNATACDGCSGDCRRQDNVCGDGVLECSEFCDDGNTLGNDDCNANCSTSLCGDGLLNQRLLAVTSLTFTFAAIDCGSQNAQAVFTVNGEEFARADFENDCFCGDRSQSVSTTNEDLLAQLLDGENTYGFSVEGSDTYTYWAKVKVDDTGEETVIYEQDAGVASSNASIPCGSAIFSVTPSVTASMSLYAAEPCDDGNTLNGDGCDNNCTVSACGNGIQAGSEACDASGATALCDADCTWVECGDGTVNIVASETCDDGNDSSEDGCSALCQLETCGDGVVQLSLGESCDDGNHVTGDGCSFQCQSEFCGDSILHAGLGESCDDGNTVFQDGCSATCALECGNGVIDSMGSDDEATLRWKLSWFFCTADVASQLWVYIDGVFAESVSLTQDPHSCDEFTAPLTSTLARTAVASGAHEIEVFPNGCWIASWMEVEVEPESGPARTISLFDPFSHFETSVACDDYEFVSGGSATIYSEACDDGNIVAGDGCSHLCGVEECGNGVLDFGEGCDDGNDVEEDGCSQACQPEACGDGIVHGTEECDDGNTFSQDGCSSLCLAEVCGNGRLDGTEACDDGNLIGADGCSLTCTVEICGNAIQEVGEGCDDWNTVSGDGCSSDCQLESCSQILDTDGDGLPDCVETNTGILVSSSDTGTDLDNPDSDNDGISDGDEVAGTASGLNLPSLGANPNRKDIFLEIDWTSDDATSNCGGSELRPTSEAIEAMVRAFAEAPVTNRDGSRGVVLHVDYGQGGVYTGGNFIAEADSFLNGALEGDFVSHKAAHFSSNREGYFHYSIRAFQFGTNGVPESAGGLGYRPGFDFLVTQGCPTALDSFTFMHELGHNLGLGHGGFNSCNYKPNYNSVMNYKYSQGAFRDCGLQITQDLIFSGGEQGNLDENTLVESDGICNGIQMDWNADGNYTTVQANVNSQEPEQSANCGGTFTVLKDHDDWSNLIYLGPMNPNTIFLHETVQ